MSIRSVPLIVFGFIAYFVVVLFGGDDVTATLKDPLFSLGSMRGEGGAKWVFSVGDLLIFFTLILLFIEILKATYTSTTSLVDHGLSMLVFIACLVSFLMVDAAYTSVFFMIMVMTLIDVIAGYTIGIRVARRDIGFGGMAGQ